MYDKLEVIDVRVKNFIEKNTDIREYNTVVKATQELAIQDRAKGINRLNIPASFDVEDYIKDRVYYARNLAKLRKDNSKTNFPEDVVIEYTPKNNSGTTSNSNGQNNTTQVTTYTRSTTQPVVSTPTKPTETKVEPATQPVVSTPTKPTDTKVEPATQPVVSTPTKPTETKVEPATQPVVSTPTKPTDTKVEPATQPVVSTPTKPTDTKVEPATQPVVSTPTKPTDTKVEPATQPVVSTPTKPTETKVEPATQPVVSTPTKPTDTKVEPATQPIAATPIKTEPAQPNNSSQPARTNYDNQPPINFSTGENGGIRIITPKGFIPFPSVEYDPSGKTVTFKGLVINEAISPFEFTDVENNVFRQQDHLGKIVVLDFWATWCGPCKPTLEYTQRLAKKYSDKDVVFVYVSADSDEATWKEYLKDHPMKGIQGRDDNALIRINQRVPGVPNYFVIDKKGRVAFNSLIESKQNAEEMIDILLRTP